MATFILIAKVQSIRNASFLDEAPLPAPSLCPVIIEGEVAKPGEFLVPLGVEVSKILKKARPKATADLTSWEQGQRVEGPLTIRLEERLSIEVTLEGLFDQPLTLTVPNGARLSDLRHLVVCDEGLKRECFKGNRRLKHQEKIEISKKLAE